MIIVCPYDGVEKALARYRPSSAISILDQGERPPAMPGVASDQHLALCLSMAAAEMMQAGCREQEEKCLRELLDFAPRIDWTRGLLVHCRLGISRSPAAAFIIQCALNPGVSESDIAAAMRAESDYIDPSLMMVTRADSLLDRDGRMIDAIEEIGIGDCCLAGNTFVLPFQPAQHSARTTA